MNSGDTRVPDRIEGALRASLQPIDPGAPFTTALQARLTTADRGGTGGVADPRVPRHRLHAASLALAASVVMVLAVGWQLRSLHTEEEGARVAFEQSRVHMQLLVALEITSERLGLAQQRIAQYQSQEKDL